MFQNTNFQQMLLTDFSLVIDMLIKVSYPYYQRFSTRSLYYCLAHYYYIFWNKLNYIQAMVTQIKLISYELYSH
jgi:hypothetical protein